MSIEEMLKNAVSNPIEFENARKSIEKDEDDLPEEFIFKRVRYVQDKNAKSLKFDHKGMIIGNR